MAPSSAEEGRAGPPPPEPLPGSTLSVLPPDDRADGDGGDVAEDVVEAEEEDVEEVEEVAGMGMVEAALPEPNQMHSVFWVSKDVTCTHSQTRASQQSQTQRENKKKKKKKQTNPAGDQTQTPFKCGKAKAGLFGWEKTIDTNSIDCFQIEIK